MEDFDLILQNHSGIELVADLVDSITEEVPIAGKLVKVKKAYTAFRDASFIRKIEVVLNQLSDLDAERLGFVVDNLRKEHGAEYFNDALFNAIEKSDSTRRAEMIGRLIVLCSNKTIPLTRFWDTLYILQTLPMKDLTRADALIEFGKSQFEAFYNVDKENKAQQARIAFKPAMLFRWQAVGAIELISTNPDGSIDGPEIHVDRVEWVRLCMGG